MYSWNIEKLYIFYFLKKPFSIIKSGWLIHFLHLIGVFVLIFLLLFHILMASLAFFFSRKHCTLPTTLKMGCIFLRINLLKVSCRTRWKWHFRDPKLRNFLGSIPLDLVGWADFGATPFFLACVHLQNLTLRSWLLFRYLCKYLDLSNKFILSLIMDIFWVT